MTQKKPACRVSDCEIESVCKGFCKKHYTAARRAGDPALKQQPPCTQEGCDLLAYSRGYCDNHYAIARRRGELEAAECVVARCVGAVHAHGLCINHYLKQRRADKRRSLLDALDPEKADDSYLTKQCCKCLETKPHPEFYRKQSVENGRSSWCITCTRTAKIMKKYGVDEERARGLACATTCASCGGALVGVRLAVDHCHETGQVRETLCHGCNSALGMLGEDPRRIRALAEYAEKWNERLHGGSI
jgi:hypothetical protein